MRGFDGRVVMVVGGGHGIGRATATRLSAEGASVAVADVDYEAADAAADQCRRLGAYAMAVGCDITDRSTVDTAVRCVVERFERLDVLVNAAGGDRKHPPFSESGDNNWRALIELNLIGVVSCIRTALPHLLAAPAGNVVTIGSINGLTALGSEPYSAAKAGLQSLTANLAAQYGRRGVRFNLIAPGTVRTRVWDNQPGALDRLLPLYPLGRLGEPDDIAAAVAFLASDDATWITGVTLPVDGGVHVGSVPFPPTEEYQIRQRGYDTSANSTGEDPPNQG